MAVGVRVARFNDERQAHDDRFGGVEIVGIPFQLDERSCARFQLVRVDGLREEVVGAGVDPLNAIFTLGRAP